jgi:hypothetical protein
MAAFCFCSARNVTTVSAYLRYSALALIPTDLPTGRLVPLPFWLLLQRLVLLRNAAWGLAFFFF